jgi:gliding motility-associated lipoprotein GldH
MKKFFFYSILLVILFSSCGRNILFEKVDHISDEKWASDHILKYQFKIVDTTQFYDIFINVRNSTDYPYQNLYLFLINKFPSGVTVTDSIEALLCDPFGNWYGKGSGRIKDHRLLMRQKVRFQQKGVYNFSFQHAMRDEDLIGITEFGITIQEHKPIKKD